MYNLITICIADIIWYLEKKAKPPKVQTVQCFFNKTQKKRYIIVTLSETGKHANMHNERPVVVFFLLNGKLPLSFVSVGSDSFCASPQRISRPQICTHTTRSQINSLTHTQLCT